MRPGDVIQTKRDGGRLSPEQIDAFVGAAARLEGSGWEKYHLTALLMAIYLNDMAPDEAAHLTRAMADSGTRLDLFDIEGPKVDKHSTGGVGDKTSLILGPLAAACGVVVPMMSGRGLGHSGGTLDKLEAIPGFNVHLSEAEFRAALRNVGLGMIGQTADIAPADKTLYALRDVTATVESIPLITASILSKKLSEGISGLVMDVKSGRGAFMKTRDRSRALAQSIVKVGTANGLNVSAFITAMDAPLGRFVGNALEVVESIETLKGNGPKDLTELSVKLAARMVRIASGAPDDTKSEALIREALASGAGLEVFRKCIEQQGGDPRVIDDYSRLPTTRTTTRVNADRTGFVATIDAEKVGIAARVLGGGRSRAEDAIDPAVGVIVRAKSGERVTTGDAVFEVHYRDDAKLASALPILTGAFQVTDAPPAEAPLILEELA
ncbi:pyrimidine-nucleoside phosphorylase : Pyrimidine-nucleoside phosphorylase OS=Myxococcus stipitatus (strain DSM 14675 / JCM 12634 / Mx s8) GN=MYSTI_06301 PE=4 SV=1: Glycos_trans_3N: Glycos_transf_3: PYNP_C [Gemmata massiliana]|uniref:thymidine phosphorylase n=1 Tax=Gemmata massiliana TaxID=1210884 RepID=A0A6P2D211_9BACT|nr:thymidine phosphorylase [Gemmata massiliana]VTR93472.1 pyrimidine-nucleoside phosphorylase : Pyrimidine-nucleoside phosphorylase OS=Myxococcus stipitatus (strain DSM 14675 / JCM 12634 / Mx s8) GN=MYSTI_06301 PE=4 SV=1: Glycos_trans_3N: Glycos_transf_3: PYNP_C [Gemmata massiliana]